MDHYVAAEHQVRVRYMLTLFEELQAVAGSAGDRHHGTPKPGERRRGVLDRNLARRTLGWTPQLTL